MRDKVNDSARLELMRDAIANIEEFMTGVDSCESFVKNKLLCHAVIYNLQCICRLPFRDRLGGDRGPASRPCPRLLHCGYEDCMGNNPKRSSHIDGIPENRTIEPWQKRTGPPDWQPCSYLKQLVSIEPSPQGQEYPTNKTYRSNSLFPFLCLFFAPLQNESTASKNYQLGIFPLPEQLDRHRLILVEVQ